MTAVSSKKRRSCEICINCRSARKHCDKNRPCQACHESNKRCLYATQFPYTHLPPEKQAEMLDRLLADAHGRWELLKTYIDRRHFGSTGWPVTKSPPKQLTSRELPLDVPSEHTVQRSAPPWAANMSCLLHPGIVHEKMYKANFDRNPQMLHWMHHSHSETARSAQQPLRSENLAVSYEIARAMISSDELDKLICLYNDCFSFSALPEFLSSQPHVYNEDGRFLVDSVLTLMLTHVVNLHAVQMPTYHQLAAVFYRHTISLRDQRLAVNPDILCLHVTYNLMLYEAENGYVKEAAASRQLMTGMMNHLHTIYHTMSVWQQNLQRHLFWAILTTDVTAHRLVMEPRILQSPYMFIGKQRPSPYSLHVVDRLKEEYIYFRCKLATVLYRIYCTCYQQQESTVHGSEIKELEDNLWTIYDKLPWWIKSQEQLSDVDLENKLGYEGLGTDGSIHPFCKQLLRNVWMRRLRYHFLVEWHGAWLYLFLVFLPRSGDIVQLPFIRCLEHAKCVVDILSEWAKDRDYFDCYCYPALRSILMTFHVQQYFLASDYADIRDKGHALMTQLLSVLERSTMYSLYKSSAFIHTMHLHATQRHF
ncbi:uncharacterized protein BYT42DRAFT_646058 [Radiomyces spectabilis]|uniref:uncharacterized protein n=1 Tax=Radiomyces spectabilis TaxID=64574 RepID=UPI0022203328|nr:uncharacterized protein BYT42DRAFT_646058 [Radiomyces spectabilis]KAI8376465.1 hypothetical protein BYT42DRAFT_646058 [Radiomyces spectabilis]